MIAAAYCCGRIDHHGCGVDIRFPHKSGEVLCAQVSAKKRIGLDSLLDKILLQAELVSDGH